MKTVTLSDKQLKTALRLCDYESVNKPNELRSTYYFKRGRFDFNLDYLLNTERLEVESYITVEGVDYRVVLNDIQEGMVKTILAQEFDDLHPEEDGFTSEEERLLAYLENSSYDTYSDERKLR